MIPSTLFVPPWLLLRRYVAAVPVSPIRDDIYWYGSNETVRRKTRCKCVVRSRCRCRLSQKSRTDPGCIRDSVGDTTAITLRVRRFVPNAFESSIRRYRFIRQRRTTATKSIFHDDECGDFSSKTRTFPSQRCTQVGAASSCSCICEIVRFTCPAVDSNAATLLCTAAAFDSSRCAG
jgi:hypothetical protein